MLSKAVHFPTDEERLIRRNQALEDEKTGWIIEVDHLKTLLRKYAFTVVGPASVGNIQCNCCHYFGLYAHKEGCELAPYLTKASPPTSATEQK